MGGGVETVNRPRGISASLLETEGDSANISRKWGRGAPYQWEGPDQGHDGRGRVNSYATC